MAPVHKESPLFLILLLIVTASASSPFSSASAPFSSSFAASASAPFSSSFAASASTSRSSTAFLIMPNDAVARVQALWPPSLPATGKVGSANDAVSGQPSPASSLPPSPPETPQQPEVAAIGSSDPGILVKMMDGASPLWLPRIATLFIYENDGVPDPHSFFSLENVVPERLTFADLRLLETNSRLPMLHPGKFLTITNNSEVNFTVDDSRLSEPDAYVTRERVVHRVAKVPPANVSDAQSKSFWYPIVEPLVKYALAVIAVLAVLWGVYMWCPNAFKCLAFCGLLKLFGGSSTSTGGTGLQATARVVTEGLAGLISNVTGAVTGRAAVSNDGGFVGSGPIEAPVGDSSPGFLRRFVGGAAGLLGALVGIGRVAGQPRQREVELESLLRQPNPPENEQNEGEQPVANQPAPETANGAEAANQPAPETANGAEAANQPAPEAANQPPEAANGAEAANQPAPESANQPPEANQPVPEAKPLAPPWRLIRSRL